MSVHISFHSTDNLVQGIVADQKASTEALVP